MRKQLMRLVPAIMLLMMAGVAFAQEEAKPPLLPALTGSESQQTYMQGVWVVAIFVILLAILYPTAWKNVLAGLKARESRIRKDIAEAEEARTKAEATLREYAQQLATAQTKVQQMISDAANEAEKIAAGIRTRSQSEAEEIKERATRDIEAARKQALTEIYEQTANLATNVAEKILRRNLNADDQRDLVAQSVQSIQNSGRN